VTDRPRRPSGAPDAHADRRRRPGTASRTYAAARAETLQALPAADRHLVRRFSWGLTPALAEEVRRAGGGRPWFERQLRPADVPDPAGADIDTWYPSTLRSPKVIWDRHHAELDYIWDVVADLSRRTVARRIHGRRQVHELMVDFWSNLLHVTLGHEEAQFWRMDYDRVIRANALGTFEKLLQRTITHPAMGLYLDNAFSSKWAPNENLGRELLELHTVGVDAGYTEDDVKASARMLTGYRVDLWDDFAHDYEPEWHDTDPVQVMSFKHRNDKADGRAATLAYLSYLAHHPATARRLAHRLCVRFVSDTPSRAIVDAVAKAYKTSRTAIVPTLRALVSHPDFDAAPMSKVRMPTEDYVATVRALGIRLQRPGRDDAFANAMYWQYTQAGQPPYEWPAPNGYPEVGAAWSSAGRVLTSVYVHRDLAARWWPTERATFPTERSMLPPMPATLLQVIDHLGLRLLGERPRQGIAEGVATVVGLPLSQRLTADEVVDSWTFTRIVASLLDSPLHLHR
jgi:hypothetical protein